MKSSTRQQGSGLAPATPGEEFGAVSAAAIGCVDSPLQPRECAVEQLDWKRKCPKDHRIVTVVRGWRSRVGMVAAMALRARATLAVLVLQLSDSTLDSGRDATGIIFVQGVSTKAATQPD